MSVINPYFVGQTKYESNKLFYAESKNIFFTFYLISYNLSQGKIRRKTRTSDFIKIYSFRT